MVVVVVGGCSVAPWNNGNQELESADRGFCLRLGLACEGELAASILI